MLTHLYEIVQQRAAAHPTATAVGGQEGLRWHTLDSRQLLALVDRLNKDPAVNGILVQLPLPDHLSVLAVHEAIPAQKDVDALTPVSVGRLVRGEALFLPATPFGVLDHT